MEDLETRLKACDEKKPCPNQLMRDYVDRIVHQYNRNCPAEEVPLFVERFPTLFKMLNSDADLKMLELFLNQLGLVQSGKAELKETEQKMASVLNEEYVKPTLRSHGLED